MFRLPKKNRPSVSLSARRAWIEIVDPDRDSLNDDVALRKESVDRNVVGRSEGCWLSQSLSARRAWIEITSKENTTQQRKASLSARRAWIEILYQLYDTYAKVVALRKESVDRNLKSRLNKKLLLSRSPQGERG